MFYVFEPAEIDRWLLAAMGGMLLQRGASGHCHTTTCWASTLPEPEKTPAARSAVRRACTSTRASRSTGRSKSLYRFWRNLENLPQFMHHLESVERVTDTLSRWRACDPAARSSSGTRRSSTRCRTRSSAGARLKDVRRSAGSVNFDDAGPGRGTRVQVHLQHSPPGGKVGAAVARLLGCDAATEIREDCAASSRSSRRERFFDQGPSRG